MVRYGSMMFNVGKCPSIQVHTKHITYISVCICTCTSHIYTYFIYIYIDTLISQKMILNLDSHLQKIFAYPVFILEIARMICTHLAKSVQKIWSPGYRQFRPHCELHGNVEEDQGSCRRVAAYLCGRKLWSMGGQAMQYDDIWGDI